MGLFVTKNQDNLLKHNPKLIVGLRNPGEKYLKTRHNAGFMAIKKWHDSLKLKKELQAMVYEKPGNPKVIIATPTTFMNESGLSLIKIANYFGINSEDILIIHDDKDLAFGDVRLKFAGSSAGHNGLNSIDNTIGEQYWRIRIGIANDLLEHQDTADFVLSNFSKDELNEFNAVTKKVEDKIEEFLNK